MWLHDVCEEQGLLVQEGGLVDAVAGVEVEGEVEEGCC